jgi:hypothetical protein
MEDITLDYSPSLIIHGGEELEYGVAHFVRFQSGRLRKLNVHDAQETVFESSWWGNQAARAWATLKEGA